MAQAITTLDLVIGVWIAEVRGFPTEIAVLARRNTLRLVADALAVFAANGKMEWTGLLGADGTANATTAVAAAHARPRAGGGDVFAGRV